MSTLEQLIPEGYKHTDSGVIPDDWKVLKIDDMSTKVGSGKTPTGGASVYVDSGRPFVRSQNVGSGRLRLADLTYITEETHSTFTGSELKTDDVLLNITGASIGRCALATPSVDGGNVNQHVCIIRVNRAKVAPYLIQTLINSDSGQNQIDSYQAGGNREGLNFSQVRNMQFPLSNHIEEQTAIANALSDVDALLAELEKLIAKKQAIKTATMQQLLTGKTRLPQFATYTESEKQGQPKGTKSSELGEIPEDWEVKTYSDIFSFLTTASNSRSDLSEIGGIGYIHYGDIHTKWDNLLDLSDSVLPYISEEKVTSAVFLKNGDLVMADASEDYEGIGKSIEITGIGDRKVISGLHTFLLRDKSNVFSEGFRGYLHAIPAVKSIFDRLATGLKVYGLSKSSLKNVPLPVPPKEEQTAISTILSDMDREIQTLEQRLAKTRQIKQGMMQELLTGRTRLPFKKES